MTFRSCTPSTNQRNACWYCFTLSLGSPSKGSLAVAIPWWSRWIWQFPCPGHATQSVRGNESLSSRVGDQRLRPQRRCHQVRTTSEPFKENSVSKGLSYETLVCFSALNWEQNLPLCFCFVRRCLQIVGSSPHNPSSEQCFLRLTNHQGIQKRLVVQNLSPAKMFSSDTLK